MSIISTAPKPILLGFGMTRHSKVDMQPATLYESLEALPEGLTGEILNGQLHTQPQPSGAHTVAGSALSVELGGPFQRGRGGPGGWWILVEPEVHFVRNLEVTVPDLAGWRRERMPHPPVKDHRFEVIPDWICEIFSPSTKSRDREVKMPLYARYGVHYVWLIDPFEHTLEAYRLDADVWVEVDRFVGTDRVAAPPFESVPIELKELWLPAGL